MPSAQERLQRDDAANGNDVSSEPSSRAYTPPLPPLATPEYVRYLQEQRLGDFNTETTTTTTTTTSQTASGNNSDSEFQPSHPRPPPSPNNNSVQPSSFASAIEVEAAIKKDEIMEKERRRREDETFAPILGPDRNPSLSGSRATSHEDLVSLGTRAVTNAAIEREREIAQEDPIKTQKRHYTELKDVAISLSENPESPRHRKNLTAQFPKLGNNKGWLRVDATGRLTKLTIEKHKISHMLRVPIRDLRVLEPAMSSSYSTSIWCRERSIVVNLEQIKILITAEEVICPDSKNSAVVERYIPELQRRLQRRIKIKETSEKEDKTKKSMPETFSSFALSEVAEKSSIKEKEHQAERKLSNSGYTSFDEEEMKGHEGGHHRTSFDTFGRPTPEGSEFSSEAGSDETLPFELIALEIALEMVCNALEVESDKVEREGKPQLEKLRQEVNQTNLEKVRRVKNRLVRINARVSKVREEIQRYLDDDSDMRDLYLTRRLREELRQNTARSNRESGVTPSPAGANRGGRGLGSQPPLSPLNQSQRATPNQMPNSPNTSGQVQIIGPNGEVWDEDKDLQEVEDLFETYFTHIDSTFRNLEQLNEYIDDMEDLIEIELDSKRNQLIKLELLLTTGTLCLSGFGVVVGVFGMNIKNGLEGSQSSFELVIVFSVLGSVLTFAAIVQACRYFRLF